LKNNSMQMRGLEDQYWNALLRKGKLLETHCHQFFLEKHNGFYWLQRQVVYWFVKFVVT
jgi:hypothetical protein